MLKEVVSDNADIVGECAEGGVLDFGGELVKEGLDCENEQRRTEWATLTHSRVDSRTATTTL